MAQKARERRQSRVIQRGSLIRRVATVVALGFLVVGILGFIPGITTNYDTLSWSGDHSQAQLLGVFHVSALHNLLHLAYGVVGLLLALNTALVTATARTSFDRARADRERCGRAWRRRPHRVVGRCVKTSRETMGRGSSAARGRSGW